ncbi:MAG: hypothetical protein IJX27_02815 [Clostridia bacterium]|nr:hypothetical protein [Clostridia bacterium]
MKRFTAILSALCIVFAAVSCRGGGATSATPQGTIAQNTTEYTKTESTTSTTESAAKPQKPTFLHPAVEAINESIDNTLMLESFSALLGAEVYIYEENEKNTVDYVYHRMNITASGMNTAKPCFLMESRAGENYSETFDTRVYFEGRNYYISQFGIDAKIPASDGESFPSPKEIIRPVIPKFASDKAFEGSVSYKDYDIHTLRAKGGDAGAILAEVQAALTAEIAKRTNRTFTLAPTSADINVKLDADSRLSEYITLAEFDLSFEGEHAEKMHVIINTSVKFNGIGEAHTPKAPENTESFISVNSRSEVPHALFTSFAARTNENGKQDIEETVSIKRKELGGSYTPINVSSKKQLSVSGEEGAWLESSVYSIEGRNGKKTSSIYFKDNFYYVLDESGARKYGAESFEENFGYTGCAEKIPVFGREHIIFADIKSADSGENSLAAVTFILNNDAFTMIFSEYVGKTARHIAGEHGIWNYNVKNNTVDAVLDSEGFVESLTLSFDIDVIVNINGAKFSFPAKVSLAASFITPGTEATAPGDLESYKQFILQ